MPLNTDILTAPENTTSFDITQRTETFSGADIAGQVYGAGLFAVIDIVEVKEVKALTLSAALVGRLNGLNYLSSNAVLKELYYLPSALDTNSNAGDSVGYIKTVSWGVKEDQRSVGSYFSTQEVSTRISYRITPSTYQRPTVSPETTTSYPVTVTVTRPSNADRCYYYLRNLYGVFAYFQPGGSPASELKTSQTFTVKITQPAVLLVYAYKSDKPYDFGAGRVVIFP